MSVCVHVCVCSYWNMRKMGKRCKEATWVFLKQQSKAVVNVGCRYTKTSRTLVVGYLTAVSVCAMNMDGGAF